MSAVQKLASYARRGVFGGGARRTFSQYTDPHNGFGTTVIHVGNEPDAQTGAVVVPVSLATTYAQPSPGNLLGVNHQNSFGKGYEYSRTGNPTRGAYERCIAAAEGGKHGLAFSSGMAATAAVMSTLKSGDHVVCIDDVYGGTQRYFRQLCVPNCALQFDFCDMTNSDVIEAAIIPGKTKMLWLETPTNPTLKITDIKMVAAIAHKHGCKLIVDNTFMSPYFQQPLSLGADIVMSSVTKYINGHSDVVGGVLATNCDDINTDLRFVQNGTGGVPSPFDCYLAMRGMKTLHIRMAEHQRNAIAVAKYLEAHDLVEKVAYPGLESHPQHELAKKQMSGFGGMITFWIKGDITHARTFLENVHIFTMAESLGAVESLAESPAIMTHASVPPETREKLGISDCLIRLSVGIEGLPDIIADLDTAFAAVKKL